MHKTWKHPNWCSSKNILIANSIHTPCRRVHACFCTTVFYTYFTCNYMAPILWSFDTLQSLCLNAFSPCRQKTARLSLLTESTNTIIQCNEQSVLSRAVFYCRTHTVERTSLFHSANSTVLSPTLKRTLYTHTHTHTKYIDFC
jgi:hypothetical protein